MGIYLWNTYRYLTCEISFFTAGTTFTQLLVRWLRPILCYGEYTLDCNQKKIREKLLTTLTNNHNDVINVIWRLPVWNVNIRRYLASCTFQFWSNLTKISFEGKYFRKTVVYCCKYDVMDFTFSRWQILLAEPLSIIARRFKRVEWNIQLKK